MRFLLNKKQNINLKSMTSWDKQIRLKWAVKKETEYKQIKKKLTWLIKKSK
jgi:hypothetical protein